LNISSFRQLALLLFCLLGLGCTAKPTLAEGPFHLTLPASVANGALATTPAEPPGGYVAGTVVSLSATPHAGYALDHWIGTDNPNATSLTNQVTMSADKSVGVAFKLGGPFHLTLPASTANGALTPSPTEPPGGYTSGTVVTLTAAPDPGYTLDHWTGTDNQSTTSFTNQVTMNADESVGVTFKSTAPTYLLTVDTAGNITITTASVPSQPGPNYTAGTVVTLTATIGAGHKVAWTHTDNDTSTATTSTVTMGTAPVTVTATAECDTECTLTVNVDNPSFGHVDVADGAAGLGSTSPTTSPTAFQSPVGHTLTLTAHDSLNWPFQGWMTPVASTSTCVGTIVMNTDQAASASFPLITSPKLCP
jgi:hypothetical protein